MHNNQEDVGLVRRLIIANLEQVDGGWVNREFSERFNSFMDQCPSFLHSVGKEKFFPSFLFGMFAAAFDAGVMKRGEKVYFRFDRYDINAGRRGKDGKPRPPIWHANLKLAVLTKDRNRKDVVRCFSVADKINSTGSRFSAEERDAVLNRLRNRRDELRLTKKLHCEEYKVYAHKQENDTFSFWCKMRLLNVLSKSLRAHHRI